MKTLLLNGSKVLVVVAALRVSHCNPGVNSPSSQGGPVGGRLQRLLVPIHLHARQLRPGHYRHKELR